MSEQYCLPFSKIDEPDFDRVGGKSASLGRMTRAGIAVPPGFAVTTDAYQAMLDYHGLTKEIAAQLESVDTADNGQVEKATETIRNAILSKNLPEDVETAIRKCHSEMGEIAVAVRSSATAEDMPDASFAGQQDTYLWVMGGDDVIERVRECWASLYSARAVAYRAANNITQDVLMSVAIQRMVNARSAGVAMTLDPTNGDRTRIVIDASWGLGETVVSGTVTPDNFVVEKVMQEILSRTISDKHIEMIGDSVKRAAVELEITDDRRTCPSLNDEEIMAVALLAKSLEKMNGCPQDVEWAIDADMPDGENLVALQSRPETVWSQKVQPKKTTDSASGISGIAKTLTTGISTYR